MTKINTKLFQFDDVTTNQALTWVIDNANTGEYKYVVTPNIDHTQRLIDNKEALSPLYAQADLCLCDSRILKVLLKIKGIKLESVVPGSDLTAQLFSSNKMKDLKVLVVGGNTEVFTQLHSAYSSLDLVHINPSMGFISKPEEVQALQAQIADLAPNIIFLAIGSPQQEKLANLLQGTLNKGVALCIGASILFITGEEKRAPIIFQKLHIEWLFRMFAAPRLMKRYWQNFLSLGSIYKSL